MEVLKPMIFYGGFDTYSIFTEFLKPIVFYGGFETHDI